jgi:hypothetical protein
MIIISDIANPPPSLSYTTATWGHELVRVHGLSHKRHSASGQQRLQCLLLRFHIACKSTTSVVAYESKPRQSERPVFTL